MDSANKPPPQKPPRSMLITDSNSNTNNAGAQQRPAGGDGGGVAGGADENRFFYEDEVFGWDPHERIRFGLVMETYDANYSDSEQSDAEEPALRQGEVRVAWHPRGVEEVLGETDLGLADRTLMPGDVVRRIVPGQKTQKGYCREVQVSADVNVKGTACMLRNVRADRMRSLITTMRDNAVCLDSWVGSSKLVNLKLVLRTPCGSVLELRPDQEYTRLCDQDSLNRKGFFANTAFYAGQVLVGPMHALERESVKWITTMPDVRNTKSRIAFTVVSVEVEGIMVQWKCKALSDVSDMTEAELQNHTQPKSYVTGDDLKRLHRLNIFESCMLQINDQNFLTIEPGDVSAATKKTAWRRDCAQLCGKFVGSNRRLPNKPQTDASANNNATATIHKVPTVSVTEASGAAASSVAEGQTNSQSAEGGEMATMDECSDGWITEEELDGEEGLRADGGGALMGSMDSVTTGSSCCSSPTPRSSPKRSPLLKNQMKRLQMRRQHRKPFDVASKIGEEVVTETRVVYSTATVVWQDGTIEENISSRQLYPIHHLDEHEFFPGDFVLSGQDASYRDYGVIQRVDHVGRTAVVKWFSTYTTAGQPTPTFFNETEVSVYDLKDHPDFQYRPGTIVIRVANFTGEDATCTAGQVVDNYAEGRVKVWWVDGHYSMCWPQDLFEVGNYDSDHNYWTSGDDEDDSDNGSWETDSAHSVGGDAASAVPSDMVPPELPMYIGSLERSLQAMENLQEMFCANPRLENVGAMGKLLDVYKKCRFMDRLLETSFFHEDRFLGLIERVRRTAAATPTVAAGTPSALLAAAIPVTPTAISRALDHKKRLFGELPAGPPVAAITSPPAQHPLKMPPISPSASMHMKPSIKQKLYKIQRPEICVEVPDDGRIATAAEDDADLDDVVLLNDSGPFALGAAPTGVDSPSPGDVQQSGTLITSSSPLPTETHSNAVGASTATGPQLVLLDQLNIELANQSQQHSLMSGNDSGIQTKSSEWGEASAEASSSCGEVTDGSCHSSKPGDDNTTNSCCSIEALSGGHAAVDSTAGDLEVAVSEAGAACAAGATDGETEELSEYACARLCTLLKNQMRVALRDLSDRHFKRKFARLVSGVSGELGASAQQEAAATGDAEAPKQSESDGAKAANPSPLPEADTAAPKTTPTPPATNASPAVSHTNSAVPSIVQSPDCFVVDETAPSSHHYAGAGFQPTNAAQFYRTVAFDHTLLQSSLPLGVWVRAYEDRMDLMSVMIAGPAHTPYEDGMFLFDVQLSKEYPRTPPLFHYISFCSDRLNPNLYEDGKVCVSLLGTWSGKGSEVWGPGSTLLQVIVSIQGLILVAEPYFNEAGYEKQKGSQQGIENSRMYNEMVVIKLVQSMTKLVQQTSGTFRDQIVRHFAERGRPMYERLCGWLEADCGEKNAADRPQFPLVPASRGFCLTMAGLLKVFRDKVDALGAASE